MTAVTATNDQEWVNDWTPAYAEALARAEGLELTPEHWKLINFVREDAIATGKTPGLRRVSKETGTGMKDIYRLFPKAPGKRIAQLAGVPKPKSCL
ncbi:MAG: TusE/DsrC/DsvC family sulfur relay protein [Deltaproteobacteria bacterium]|nr:MAG: TusE/DsrC/DsvC family sulfur relay protein [Deltaproteobacteria bacterium]